tara:strand:- start:14087 stop:15415 length:1329 start_codon:yes stop_codon:yes gene_type:complete
MKRIGKIIFLVTLPFAAEAQSSGVSPYSLFGLGQVQTSSFCFGQIVAGAQVANNSNLFVNNEQPASYAQLKYTTLDLGGSYSAIYQSSNNESLWNSTGGFRSMGVALPLAKRIGFAAGISPLTQVGYQMQSDGFNQNFGNFRQIFDGSGGINKSHFGFGYKPLKFLSLGINMNYLFGSIDKRVRMIFENNSLNPVMNNERLLVNGWSYDMGTILSLPMGANVLNLGVSFSPSQDISSSYQNTSITYLPNSSGSENPIDTILFLDAPIGNITLPSSLGIGIHYEKRISGILLPAWSFSLQYKTSAQTELRDFWSDISPNNGPFQEPSRFISISSSMTPFLAFPKRRYKSIFSQMAYRASFRSGNTGLVLEQASISVWESIFGLGIPLGGSSILPGDIKFATLHMGIQMGNLGSGAMNMINEFSVKALFGVTLNDQWFLKFKYR